MSTATGGYRNLDFLNAVCTPYPRKDFALDLLFFATCRWNGWRLMRPVLTDEEDAGVSVKQWLPRGR